MPRNDDLDEISMGDIPDSDVSFASQSSMDYDLDGDISDSDVSFASQSFIDLIGIGPNCEIFDFTTKGLHICNLNIRHILPKIDEIRFILSNTNSPDMFGMCESFLETHHPDSLTFLSIVLTSSGRTGQKGKEKAEVV